MGKQIPELPGYEFINRIGEGAGAVISLGIERASRRRVAIKHVVRKDDTSEKFLIQAETEYEIAHQLNHPYLRRYYDLVRVRRWLKVRELFLIMEFVDGQRLEDDCPKSLLQLIPIFMHVAEGLQAMHQAGYAHADIKPNNILLTGSGGVKIIDFGQSCRLGHRKERIQGTPDYIAPEQVNRHPIDHRTDIYNLGATMYWAVTGVNFETVLSVAPTAAKKHEIDARRSSLPPHELNPATPMPMSRLVMECVETDPARRPKDMAAVLSRLEVALHLVEKRAGEAALGGDSDER